MNAYTIENCTAGESWGCRFRIHTFVDSQGQPVNTQNLAVGQPVRDGKPGIYEGFGIIQKRDREKQLVELWDNSAGRTWIVSWQDCWDCDRVEWSESQTPSTG